MVTQPDRPGMTAAEIATKYRRSQGVVKNTWVLSDEWRARVPVVGHRGRSPEYDPDAVHALVSEWVWLPPTNSGIPANRRLTMREIAAYTGLAYSVVRSDASRGVLKGHGQEDADGNRTWTRAQVDELYYARKIRYRRTS